MGGAGDSGGESFQWCIESIKCPGKQDGQPTGTVIFWWLPSKMYVFLLAILNILASERGN